MNKNFATILCFLFGAFLCFRAFEVSDANAYEPQTQTVHTAPVAEKLWNVNADVWVDRTTVKVGVYNRYGRPIYCQGRVAGYTYYGSTIWNSMSAGVTPGSYAYVYVYTDPRDPFVDGRADIQCRWY